VALATVIALGIELAGGLISGSLALLSEAPHFAVDLSSVLIAIGVEYYILRGGNRDKKTVIRGWGGVVSSILLFVIVVLIFATAVERLFFPNPVDSGQMIIFAIAGFVGSAVSHWVLEMGEEEHDTHTPLAAHVDSDLIQSAGVIVLGLMIFVTHWQILDPMGSFVIVILLTRLSLKTLKRSWRSAHSAR